MVQGSNPSQGSWSATHSAVRSPFGLVKRDTFFTLSFDLVKDHINNNEGPSTANPSRAMNHHRPSRRDVFLSLVYIVEEVEDTARIRRDTMIWPSLEKFPCKQTELSNA